MSDERPNVSVWSRSRYVRVMGEQMVVCDNKVDMKESNQSEKRLKEDSVLGELEPHLVT